jgi:phage repressor protein C with HTH and peptisase S24 domain
MSRAEFRIIVFFSSDYRMSIDNKGLPERFFSLFPRYKQWEIAECLYPGEDGRKKQSRLSRWNKGIEPIPMDVLDRVVDLGLASWDWLLTGKGEGKDANTASPPTPKAILRDPDAPVPGVIFMTTDRDWLSPEARAAADTSARTQTAVVDGMADPISPPKKTALIPVRGDSMEPVLLDKQYAAVNWEDMGFKGDGGIYVVEVIDGEGEEPELFVKHCFQRGDMYVLQSVKPGVDNLTFPVKHVSRMWQVIGTWFIGKGKPAVLGHSAHAPVKYEPVQADSEFNPIDVVFDLQVAFLGILNTLSTAGKHIAAGKTLVEYEGNPVLIEGLRAVSRISLRVADRLESYRRPSQNQDRTA